MSDVTAALAELSNATTLEDISRIASGLSASAEGSGGILYSGTVGAASAGNVARSIAAATGQNIIDNTPRGDFLSKSAVYDQITSVLESQGVSQANIQSMATDFLYGNSAETKADSLWGQASSEYAGSLTGDITMVGTDLNRTGVVALVEVPELLSGGKVTSVNGTALGDLPRDVEGVLKQSETAFTSALDSGGVFEENVMANPSNTTVAAETLERLGYSPANSSTAAELAGNGFTSVAGPQFETGAATVAEDFLLAGGAKALGLLLGAAGGALTDLLFNSKPLNAGEDEYLAQLAKSRYDVPVVPQLDTVNQDANGGTTVIIPLMEPNLPGADQFTLSYNPLTNSVSLVTNYMLSGVSQDIVAKETNNADGTSTLVISYEDGSSATTTYAGPSGSGAITNKDTENADGTSELVKYGPNGPMDDTVYSGPNGTGSVSEEKTYDNSGAPTSDTYYIYPGSPGDPTNYFVLPSHPTNSGTVVEYNGPPGIVQFEIPGVWSGYPPTSPDGSEVYRRLLDRVNNVYLGLSGPLSFAGIHPIMYYTTGTPSAGEGLVRYKDDLSAIDYHDSIFTLNYALPDQGVACYVAGTHILTSFGEIRVENLSVGDLVATFAGQGAVLKPVRWLGHRRIDLRQHPQPENTLPVRFLAGSLGDCVPHRDLLVSPNHRMRIDNTLVTAVELVNGSTIVQESPGEVEYWHIELDGHDLVLAEGMQAETYQDVGNRSAFENAKVVAFNPMLDGDVPEPCLPYAGVSAAARERFIVRAEAMGWTRCIDPMPWLEVGAQRIEPTRQGAFCRFNLPAGCSHVRLRSRAGRPWDVDPHSGDRRSLGLKLHHLALGGPKGARKVRLNSPHLVEGFNRVEHDDAGWTWRWTDGSALLSLNKLAPGRAIAVVEIAYDQALPMWINPASIGANTTSTVTRDAVGVR
jgi:hypothetical protein